MPSFEKYDEKQIPENKNTGKFVETDETRFCDDFIKNHVMPDGAAFLTLDEGENSRSYGRLLGSAAKRAGVDITTEWFTDPNTGLRKAAVKLVTEGS